MSPVFLQGFNWKSHMTKSHFKQLSSQMNIIRKTGISHIWLPPFCKSKDPEGYHPIEYYDFSSEYGNLEDLQTLVDSSRVHGINTVADLVCWYDFCGYKRDNYKFFGRERKIDSVELFGEFKEYIKFLNQKIGIDGIRIDYVKSQPAHDLSMYLSRSSDVKNMLFISELWDTMNYDNEGKLLYDQDSHRQQIVHYLDKINNTNYYAFDFTTKGILQEAICRNEYWRLKDNNNQPTGLSGWWPQQSITFIDNHDTLGQHLWAFSYNE